MKAQLENIPEKKGQHSFLAFATRPPRFAFFWHYHPEYELTLIVKGRGRRLVGDSHENFDTGDLVLLGPGLPHTWVSAGPHNGGAEAVVIQFAADFIERFTDLDELSGLGKLLQQARQGLAFNAKKPAALMAAIQQLPAKKGVEKITGLLHILHELGKLKPQPLASPMYQPLKGQENENRLNKVCQYVQKHYADKLTIHKAAALIHLSPGAFCKFFKRITGQTFSDYVNDIRLASVCQQLLATDKPVAEIAYHNGFETLTYFNRVFLKKKGLRPSQYRGRQSP
jgi:AraC-like DNA-binding protein